MKKNLLFLSIVMLLINSRTISQSKESPAKDTLEVRRNSRGNIEYLTFKSDSSKIRPMSNEKDFISKILGNKPNDEFRLLKSSTDKDNRTVHKYQYFYKGVKVEYAQFVTSGKESIESILSVPETIDNLNATASFGSDEAINKAIRVVNAEQYLWQDSTIVQYLRKLHPGKDLAPHPELLITRANYDGIDSFCLAWKVNINCKSPDASYDVYLNAVSGELVKMLSNDHTTIIPKKNTNTINPTLPALPILPLQFRTNTAGTGATLYSGTQNITVDSYTGGYRLAETRTSNNVFMEVLDNHSYFDILAPTEYVLPTANFGGLGMGGHQQALDVHWAVENCLDYWKTIRGRNSMDNAGFPIYSYVHWGSDNSGSSGYYPNAAWRSNLGVICYGDGGLINSNLTENPMASSDIVYHEMGHAISYFTVGLIYEKESGAIDESLSDMWAAVIESWKSPTKNKWQIADEVNTFSRPLRYMNNPNGSYAGAQPDTRLGSYWVSTTSCTPSISNDYCGVHANNGVLNYWFYLCSDGGSGTNDILNTFTVAPVGITTMAAILYRAEDVYLTSGATFSTFRDAVIQATRDLYGTGSCQEINITNAFYAVNIGAAYPVNTGTQTAPSGVCNGSSATLSFSGLPSGSTVNWLITTSGLTNVTSGTGNSFTFTATTSSSVTIGVRATITYTCGNTAVITKDVRLNTAALASAIPVATTNTCGWDIKAVMPTTATSIQKSTNGGTTWTNCPIITNPSTGKSEFYVFQDVLGPATYTAQYRAVNPCGTTTALNGSWTVAARSGCMARIANSNDSSNLSSTDTTNSASRNSNLVTSKEVKVAVYPNPAINQLTIEIGNSSSKFFQIKQITVKNLQGQTVKQATFTGQTKVSLNVSNLLPGIYIINVSDGQNMKSEKVFIQRNR